MIETAGDGVATSRAWMVPFAVALAFMLAGLVSYGLKSHVPRFAVFTAATITLLTVMLQSLPKRLLEFEREFETVWTSSPTIATAVAVLFIGGKISAVLFFLIVTGVMVVYFANLDTRPRWLFVSLVTVMSVSAVALVL